MQHLRRFQPGDEAGISRVCLLTARFGGDATGMISDDRLWGDVFALPYPARDPGLTFVVDGGGGNVVGYVLGTDDTSAFEAWFRDVWWPPRAPSAEGKDRVEAGLIGFADTLGAEFLPFLAEYPAHVHIDLLPVAQGGGWGRRLMERYVDELRARGVPGVHLGASSDNTNAVAFYRHLGWTELATPDDPGTVFFGLRLT